MTKLTGKQQAFVNHYLITLNGTEAARLAKYKGNDVTLAAVAYENLRKPHIREEIDKRLAALTMSADEALFRMTQIGRGDLSRYIGFDGNINIEKLKDDGLGYLLKKYKRVKNTTTRKDGSTFENESTEAELYPADTAIERIMRARDMFGSDVGSESNPLHIVVDK